MTFSNSIITQLQNQITRDQLYNQYNQTLNFETQQQIDLQKQNLDQIQQNFLNFQLNQGKAQEENQLVQHINKQKTVNDILRQYQPHVIQKLDQNQLSVHNSGVNSELMQTSFKKESTPRPEDVDYLKQVKQQLDDQIQKNLHLNERIQKETQKSEQLRQENEQFLNLLNEIVEDQEKQVKEKQTLQKMTESAEFRTGDPEELTMEHLSPKQQSQILHKSNFQQTSQLIQNNQLVEKIKKQNNVLISQNQQLNQQKDQAFEQLNLLKQAYRDLNYQFEKELQKKQQIELKQKNLQNQLVNNQKVIQNSIDFQSDKISNESFTSQTSESLNQDITEQLIKSQIDTLNQFNETQDQLVNQQEKVDQLQKTIEDLKQQLLLQQIDQLQKQQNIQELSEQLDQISKSMQTSQKSIAAEQNTKEGQTSQLNNQSKVMQTSQLPVQNYQDNQLQTSQVIINEDDLKQLSANQRSMQTSTLGQNHNNTSIMVKSQNMQASTIKPDLNQQMDQSIDIFKDLIIDELPNNVNAQQNVDISQILHSSQNKAIQSQFLVQTNKSAQLLSPQAQGVNKSQQVQISKDNDNSVQNSPQLNPNQYQTQRSANMQTNSRLSVSKLSKQELLQSQKSVQAQKTPLKYESNSQQTVIAQHEQKSQQYDQVDQQDKQLQNSLQKSQHNTQINQDVTASYVSDVQYSILSKVKTILNKKVSADDSMLQNKNIQILSTTSQQQVFEQQKDSNYDLQRDFRVQTSQNIPIRSVSNIIAQKQQQQQETPINIVKSNSVKCSDSKTEQHYQQSQQLIQRQQVLEKSPIQEQIVEYHIQNRVKPALKQRFDNQQTQITESPLYVTQDKQAKTTPNNINSYQQVTQGTISQQQIVTNNDQQSEHVDEKELSQSSKNLSVQILNQQTNSLQQRQKVQDSPQKSIQIIVATNNTIQKSPNTSNQQILNVDEKDYVMYQQNPQIDKIQVQQPKVTTQNLQNLDYAQTNVKQQQSIDNIEIIDLLQSTKVDQVQNSSTIDPKEDTLVLKLNINKITRDDEELIDQIMNEHDTQQLITLLNNESQVEPLDKVALEDYQQTTTNAEIQNVERGLNETNKQLLDCYMQKYLNTKSKLKKTQQEGINTMFQLKYQFKKQIKQLQNQLKTQTAQKVTHDNDTCKECQTNLLQIKELSENIEKSKQQYQNQIKQLKELQEQQIQRMNDQQQILSQTKKSEIQLLDREKQMETEIQTIKQHHQQEMNKIKQEILSQSETDKKAYQLELKQKNDYIEQVKAEVTQYQEQILQYKQQLSQLQENMQQSSKQLNDTEQQYKQQVDNQLAELQALKQELKHEKSQFEVKELKQQKQHEQQIEIIKQTNKKKTKTLYTQQEALLKQQFDFSLKQKEIDYKNHLIQLQNQLQSDFMVQIQQLHQQYQNKQCQQCLEYQNQLKLLQEQDKAKQESIKTEQLKYQQILEQKQVLTDRITAYEQQIEQLNNNQLLQQKQYQQQIQDLQQQLQQQKEQNSMQQSHIQQPSSQINKSINTSIFNDPTVFNNIQKELGSYTSVIGQLQDQNKQLILQIQQIQSNQNRGLHDNAIECTYCKQNNELLNQLIKNIQTTSQFSNGQELLNILHNTQHIESLFNQQQTGYLEQIQEQNDQLKKQNNQLAINNHSLQKQLDIYKNEQIIAQNSNLEQQNSLLKQNTEINLLNGQLEQLKSVLNVKNDKEVIQLINQLLKVQDSYNDNQLLIQQLNNKINELNNERKTYRRRAREERDEKLLHVQKCETLQKRLRVQEEKLENYRKDVIEIRQYAQQYVGYVTSELDKITVFKNGLSSNQINKQQQ